jgi:hypothetical protein
MKILWLLYMTTCSSATSYRGKLRPPNFLYKTSSLTKRWQAYLPTKQYGKQESLVTAVTTLELAFIGHFPRNFKHMNHPV